MGRRRHACSWAIGPAAAAGNSHRAVSCTRRDEWRSSCTASSSRISACVAPTCKSWPARHRWLRYRLPPHYIRHDARPLCVGEKQRWFLLKLAPASGRVPASPRIPAAPGIRSLALGGDYWAADPRSHLLQASRADTRWLCTSSASWRFPAGLPPYPPWWRVGAAPAPAASRAPTP